MARKLILSGFMSALLLASVIAYSLPAFAQGPDSAGKSQVEYAFGKIPGTDIIVHVAVLVPPGLDKNEVINQALNYQGAKKIEKSEFSLIRNLDWNVLGGGNSQVEIKYNPYNEPVAGSAILSNVMDVWNGVPTSNFAFTMGSTNVCPSLVKECGSENDQENGFGWVEIKQPHTLGVTYYDTDLPGEIDIVLSTNKRISWNTDGTNYDVFTVVLHELGHGLGLGHSEVSAAVMYATYHGEMSGLHSDDECGVKELYGVPCPVDDDTTSPPTLGVESTATVTYNGKGGKLKINILLKDDNGAFVQLTPVTIKLKLDGEELSTSYTKDTGTDGEVTWNFVGVPKGTYFTSVTHVGGAIWVGTTTDSGYER